MVDWGSILFGVVLFLCDKMSDGYSVDGIEAIWLRDLIFADLELVSGQDVIVCRLRKNVTELFGRIMRTLVAGEDMEFGSGEECTLSGMMDDGLDSDGMDFGAYVSHGLLPSGLKVDEDRVDVSGFPELGCGFGVEENISGQNNCLLDGYVTSEVKSGDSFASLVVNDGKVAFAGSNLWSKKESIFLGMVEVGLPGSKEGGSVSSVMGRPSLCCSRGQGLSGVSRKRKNPELEGGGLWMCWDRGWRRRGRSCYVGHG